MDSILYHAAMSRFGIRKKLKSAVRKVILGDSPAFEAAPSQPPSPSPNVASPSPPKMPSKAAAAPGASLAPKPRAKPTATPAEPDRSLGTSWVQAAGVKPDEVVPGAVHTVQIFGKRYALYKTDGGDFYATTDGCPHAGGPLAEGELDGFEVTCPFHSWTFDVRDGSCTSGQEMGVDCTAVRVVEEMVLLEVPL